MTRYERLRRRQDFAAVHREGRSTSGDLLVLRIRPNDLPFNRYGYSVGKRVGKAVVRNKVKRRLRAAIAGMAAPLAEAAAGRDVVIIARAPAATVDYDELVRALTRLLRRARLLNDTVKDER